MQTVCHRQTARQATSAVAHVAPLPDEDDPLLGFAPYLHPHPRSNSITPERQRRFVATLAATGIVTQAARSIGKSMEALYKLRAKPGAEGFAAAWDAALERGVQRLEDCALERALKGTPTPIVSGGRLLGTWDKPDNGLLRFLLAQRMPQRYGPARAAATPSEVRGRGAGDDGAPVRRPGRMMSDGYENTDEFIAKVNQRFEVLRRKMILAGRLVPSEAEKRAIEQDRNAFFALCLT